MLWTLNQNWYESFRLFERMADGHQHTFLISIIDYLSLDLNLFSFASLFPLNHVDDILLSKRLRAHKHS